MRLLLARAAVAAAVLTIATGGPGSGRVAASSFVQAVYADFQQANAAGAVLVDQISSGKARVTTALGHLVPGHRYRLIFSRDGCATPLADADRIARVWLRANADGAVFTSMLVGTNGGVWRDALSARLMEEEGIYYFCRAVEPVDGAGTAQPDGAYGRFNGTARGLPGIAFDRYFLGQTGLKPNARYRLVYSPSTCKELSNGAADHPILIGAFRADANGMAFLSRTETVSKDEMIAVRSARTETVNNNETIVCANLHPFVRV